MHFVSHLEWVVNSEGRCSAVTVWWRGTAPPWAQLVSSGNNYPSHLGGTQALYL